MARPERDKQVAMTSPRVLVIDDNEANLALLARLLETMGITDVTILSDSRQVAAQFLASDPDLVVLDLHMPVLDGFGVLDELGRHIAPGDFRPVLVLTADAQQETKQRALRAGAHDFLVKPVDLTEATLRIRNLLETRRLHVALRTQNTELQQSLDEQRAVDDQRKSERADQRLLIEAVLRDSALAMVYQPIIDLETSHMVGVEALARFAHEPRHGPEWWFALADEVGLGTELEMAAVTMALEETDDIPADVFVSVNVSPALVGSPALLAALRDTNPERLVLELTEHAAIGDYRSLADALIPLRARGSRLAVDDTGAGFASLRHILGLSPEIIKLDLALTRGIDEDPVRRALASALISFANDIGATLVAEGVETEAELSVLRRLGARWGQGYVFSRPVPAGQLGAVV